MIFNREVQPFASALELPLENVSIFSSARSAILYIIKKKCTSSNPLVALPCFFCPSVKKFLRQNGCLVVEYPVKFDDLFSSDLLCMDVCHGINPDALIILDFMGVGGVLSDELKTHCVNHGITLICDRAQYFCSTDDLPSDIYNIVGLRKIFGSGIGSIVFPALDYDNASLPKNILSISECLLRHQLEILAYRLFSNNIFERFLGKALLSQSVESSNLMYRDFTPLRFFRRKYRIDDKILRKRRVVFNYYNRFITCSHKIYLNNLFVFNCNKYPIGYPVYLINAHEVRRILWDSGVHSYVFWAAEDEKIDNYDTLFNRFLILPVASVMTMKDVDLVCSIVNKHGVFSH